jgi:hypothetical protein
VGKGHKLVATILRKVFAMVKGRQSVVDWEREEDLPFKLNEFGGDFSDFPADLLPRATSSPFLGMVRRQD